MAAATDGQGLDPEEGHLVRVVEYDVPDRTGNGTGELIVLLSTITDPHDASAAELADSYHQRWEQESVNDQLKTHLRGPGKVLRSRLPDLVHQEIWAWLIVHYAIAVLISRGGASSRHRPRPDLVHPDPAPRPSYRHRYGGLSPFRTGTTPSPRSWLRSAAGESPSAATAPAHGHSNASGTTATVSRNAARPAAPATPAQQPSESTPSNHEQPDRELRYVDRKSTRLNSS